MPCLYNPSTTFWSIKTRIHSVDETMIVVLSFSFLIVGILSIFFVGLIYLYFDLFFFFFQSNWNKKKINPKKKQTNVFYCYAPPTTWSTVSSPVNGVLARWRAVTERVNVKSTVKYSWNSPRLLPICRTRNVPVSSRPNLSLVSWDLVVFPTSTKLFITLNKLSVVDPQVM